ncbi:unnamed protein product [Rotaria socialis]|uniref:Ig-like domain-containing protein n=1 Tax=Rotaria socialis TaxID=392032 RepID=A0A821ZQW7_9BILA|nr:unnamed protein product [Rotaria socialis]
MYTITILLITIVISTVQPAPPRSATKLTFIPDDKYLPLRKEVTIKCEIINPSDHTEPPQLWHVDLKTGKRTSISRALLTNPMEDAPDVFKNNKNQRYSYVNKNNIRIRDLQPEDSARYECDCPDCADAIASQNRTLSVMKLSTPKWEVGPGWPLHEESQAKIKCEVNDFFPYVGHKILRNHIDITNDGKSTSALSNSGYPQKFVWEATITVGAEWHNSTIYCNVLQGSIAFISFSFVI